MKKLNYGLIVSGIIGVPSAVVVSLGIATQCFSPDCHMTSSGLHSLLVHRLLVVGSGLVLLALGVTYLLLGQGRLQVVRDLHERLHPIWLGVLAGVTRFYGIGAKSLWCDELVSVVVAKGELATVIEQVNQRPPLHDVILHFFMLLGNSELMVRLPAAVFGIGAVVSVYCLTRELIDSETAVLSSLLLAVSRFHIHYSQEARNYSLFSFLAVLSMLFFTRHLRRAGRRNLVLWIVASICLMYTHYYGAFVLLAQVIYLLLLGLYHTRRRDSEWRPTDIAPYGLGLLTIAVFYLPWLPFLRQHLHGPMVWRDAIRSGSHVDTTLGYYRSIVWAFSWPSYPTRRTYVEFLRGALPLLALSGLAFHLVRREKLKTLMLLSLWGGVPLVSATAFGMNLGPRYFIFVSPVYLIFISLGIVGYRELAQSLFGGMSNGHYYLAVAILLGLVIAPSLYDYYYLHEKEDWREVGRYLEKHTTIEDSVLVLGGSSSMLEYYYGGEAAVFDDGTGDPEYLRDFEGLRNLVDTRDCLWVFVSGHSTTLYRFTEPSKKETARRILQGNLLVVDGVYDDNPDNLDGLYRSRYCASDDDD